MKKWLNLKLCIYYIIGFISFSIIAYITQTIVLAILMKNAIYPAQDIYNISNIILNFYKYYLSAYTILYFLILYVVRKYDKYIVNKLNEKLEKARRDINEKR